MGHTSKRVTHDTTGRPYAKLSQLTEGDQLVPDGGFDCMKMGEPLEVWKDDHGLYLECLGPGGGSVEREVQKHYLSEQADDGEYLIGLYRREDY